MLYVLADRSTSAYRLYRMLRTCGIRVQPVPPMSSVHTTIIMYLNPNFAAVKPEFFAWLKKWRSIYAIIATEGPLLRKVKSVMSILKRFACTSQFVRREVQKLGYDCEVVEPFVNVKEHIRGFEERPFDIAFIASRVGGARIRKGVDIFRHVVQNTGFRAITNYDHGVVLSQNVDPQDVYEYAKFLLFPSRSEGFGIPPLEAMAVGTVPICSDAPAHNEHCTVKVPTRYIGIVKLPEHDYPFYWYESCWKDYVKAIYESIPQWDRLSEMARDYASRYTIDRFCSSIRSAFLI